MPMMLDFSNELEPLTPTETYEALFDALDLRSGFGLMFLQCAPAEADRLIPKIRKELPGKNIGVLELKEPIDNLFDLVASWPDRDSLNVLFIRGLEKSLESDIKPGYGGLGDYYNLNTVPPILSHLNQQRENFRDHFRNICFVFVLPKFAIQYFIRRAPDFFDWNSGLFELPDELSQGNSFNVTLSIILNHTHNEIHNELLDKGNSLCKLGKYQEAIKAYEEALGIKSDKYEAQNNKGSALAELGRYQEAINAYDQALALKPDLYEALNNKGLVLAKLRRYEEAVTFYDQALSIKPDVEIFHNKGFALVELGRYEEAITVYDEALAIDLNLHETLNDKGVTLTELGRYEEAIAAYDQALAIKPNDEAFYNKGVVLRNLGRYKEAIAAYDRALAIKPDKQEAHFNKSCAFALSGEPDRAIAALQTAISLDPKNRELAKTDTDFDAIRDHLEFQQLLAESS
jgi:tetratricopeptide (TPR) repeat protein